MNKTLFIYFAGVDGCGKSTIIQEIIKAYSEKGIEAKSVWLRFNYFLTRPVLLLCRILGITRRERRGEKIISVHDFHKSKIIAFMVQYLHFIDTVFAYIFKVWIPLKFTDNIILCDKFVYDIIADYIVETKDFTLLNKNITKLLLKLIPENSTTIFFTADKDEIIRRKPEVLVDDEDYHFKYKAYEAIMDKFNLTVIRNDDLKYTIQKVKKIIGL